MPVACAKALGGVLIGNIIANDEPIATPINKVGLDAALKQAVAKGYCDWSDIKVIGD